MVGRPRYSMRGRPFTEGLWLLEHPATTLSGFTLGRIGAISICASTHETVQRLAEAETIARAFPGQSFRALPEGPGPRRPELYRDALAQLPPRQIVVVALPDQLHFEAIMEALRRDQHVCAVKPLVLERRQAVEIEQEARRRNLLVWGLGGVIAPFAGIKSIDLRLPGEVIVQLAEPVAPEKDIKDFKVSQKQ